MRSRNTGRRSSSTRKSPACARSWRRCLRRNLSLMLAGLLLATSVHAKESGGAVVVLAGANEPGERMIVTGRIWKADGKRPAGNERVLVYHTDTHGDYGSRPQATALQ